MHIGSLTPCEWWGHGTGSQCMLIVRYDGVIAIYSVSFLVLKTHTILL
jgi:hypothetical protein